MRDRRAHKLLLTLLTVSALAGAVWFLVGTDSRGGAEQASTNVFRPAQSTADLASSGVTAKAEVGPAERVSAVRRTTDVRGVRLAGEGRLRGRVVTLEGTAVGDAVVRLWPLPPAFESILRRGLAVSSIDADFRSRVLPIATTTSGTDGSFAFEGVLEGRYFIDARGASHVPHAASVARVLASGDGGPVEVLMRPGGAIEGRVLDPEGDPARGGVVTLYQGVYDVFDAARRSDTVFLESPIGAGGRFRFDGVPPGTGYDLAAHGRVGALTHATDFEVVAGRTTQAELQLRVDGEIEGRVLLADASGEAAEPAPGALVGVVPRGLRDLGFVRAIVDRTLTTAGEDGSFVIRGVPPGEVDVVAWTPDRLPEHRAGVRSAPGGRVGVDPLVLRAGDIVSGVIVDDAGEPVEGARLRWELADWSELEFDFSIAPLLYQSLDDEFFPVSDAEGRFRAGPFPGSGRHRMWVLADGFGLTEHRWDPERDGDEITIRITRGGRAAGIVIDGETARPVTSFAIETASRIDESAKEPSSLNPFSGGTEIEHEQGRFDLGPLAPGKATLTVRAEGYRPQDITIGVTPGETARGVIVKLERGVVVEGRAVDEDGEPVAGARVVAVDGRGRVIGRPNFVSSSTPGGRLPGSSLIDEFLQLSPLDIGVGAGLFGDAGDLTDRDGTFLIEGLPEGALRFAAAHRDFAPVQSGSVQLSLDAPPEPMELVFLAGARLEGRVEDLRGRPVEGALVLAVSPSDGDPGASGGLYQARSNASGQYVIENMCAGSYFVLTTRPDEGLNPSSFIGGSSFDLVTVPRSGTVELDLVDRSLGGTRVTGLVLDGGEPVGTGALFAANYDSDNLLGLDFKVARVRGDGSYEFPGLEPGIYQWTYQGGQGEVQFEVDVPDTPEHRHDVLLPTGRVEGVVRDRATGQGVRYAEVVVVREGGVTVGSGLLAQAIGRRATERRAYTDGEGAYRFPALQPGIYTVTVNGPRFGEDRGRYAGAEAVELTVEEGARVEGFDFELDASLTLTGRVVDDRGQPISGARILCLARDRAVAGGRRPRSDGDGRFVLSGLTQGLHDITVTHPDHADGRLEGIDVTPASIEEPLEVVLEQGVELSVLVRVDGAPAAGALARVMRSTVSGLERSLAAESAFEGLMDGRGVVDADGRARLGRVAPGIYRIEVDRGGRSAVVDAFEVVPGPPLEIPIDLE